MTNLKPKKEDLKEYPFKKIVIVRKRNKKSLYPNQNQLLRRQAQVSMVSMPRYSLTFPLAVNSKVELLLNYSTTLRKHLRISVRSALVKKVNQRRGSLYTLRVAPSTE